MIIWIMMKQILALSVYINNEVYKEIEVEILFLKKIKR